MIFIKMQTGSGIIFIAFEIDCGKNYVLRCNNLTRVHTTGYCRTHLNCVNLSNQCTPKEVRHTQSYTFSSVIIWIAYQTIKKNCEKNRKSTGNSYVLYKFTEN